LKDKILVEIQKNVDKDLLPKVLTSLNGIKSIVNNLDVNGKIGGDLELIKSSDGKSISYDSKFSICRSKLNIKSLNDMIDNSIKGCENLIELSKKSLDFEGLKRVRAERERQRQNSAKGKNGKDGRG
jgi:hypothetical protein